MPTAIAIDEANRQYRATIPARIARELQLFDDQNQHYRYGMVCGEEGPELELTFGVPESDRSDELLVILDLHNEQARFKVSPFFGAAWNLEGVELEWPDEIDTSGDTTTIRIGLQDWRPHTVVEDTVMDEQLWMSNTARENEATVQFGLPKAAVDSVGLEGEPQPIWVTFDCVAGRQVAVVTEREDADTSAPNALTISASQTASGNYQYYLQAKRLASVLGILGPLEDGPVNVEWCSPIGTMENIMLLNRLAEPVEGSA